MPALSSVTALYHPSETVDNRPGSYYVSIIDGTRFSLALGPFSTHAEALGKVEVVRRYVSDHYAEGWFYAYGTCRLEVSDRPGVLNSIDLAA